MKRDDFEPAHEGGGPATTGEPGEKPRRVMVMRATINLRDLEIHLQQVKFGVKGGAK